MFYNLQLYFIQVDNSQWFMSFEVIISIIMLEYVKGAIFYVCPLHVPPGEKQQ